MTRCLLALVVLASCHAPVPQESTREKQPAEKQLIDAKQIEATIIEFRVCNVSPETIVVREGNMPWNYLAFRRLIAITSRGSVLEKSGIILDPWVGQNVYIPSGECRTGQLDLAYFFPNINEVLSREGPVDVLWLIDFQTSTESISNFGGVTLDRPEN